MRKSFFSQLEGHIYSFERPSDCLDTEIAKIMFQDYSRYVEKLDEKIGAVF